MDGISVVVVNWNAGAALRECLEALFRSETDGKLDVWVVDNASTDGSQVAALRAWPAVNLIRNEVNRGFASAVNQGLREVRMGLTLLLNPDVILEPCTISMLATFMESHPDAGVVGPRLLDPNGAIQGSARREPSVLTGLFGRRALFTRLFPANHLSRWELPGLWHTSGEPMAVDWVSGACILVRRVAYEEVGLLDERFFLFWEDADWCRRFREAGWKVFYQPGARATHAVGVSRTRRSIRSTLDFHQSAYRYYRKHRLKGRARLLTPLLAGGLLVSLALRLPEAIRRRRPS